tara:strand:- start:411 stop:602 length:192 start_codon:yes stop_codon:yes gene_type:complete
MDPKAMHDNFEAKVYKRLLTIADAEKANASWSNDDVDNVVAEFAENNVAVWASTWEARIWKYV